MEGLRQPAARQRVRTSVSRAAARHVGCVREQSRHATKMPLPDAISRKLHPLPAIWPDPDESLTPTLTRSSPYLTSTFQHHGEVTMGVAVSNLEARPGAAQRLLFDSNVEVQWRRRPGRSAPRRRAVGAPGYAPNADREDERTSRPAQRDGRSSRNGSTRRSAPSRSQHNRRSGKTPAPEQAVLAEKVGSDRTAHAVPPTRARISIPKRTMDALLTVTAVVAWLIVACLAA